MTEHLPIIRFDDALLQKLGDPQQYIQSHFVEQLVTYVINSDYRRAVGLKSWLEAQVTNPAQSVKDFIVQHPGLQGPMSNDERVIRVLRFVQQEITYVTDSRHWNQPEHWSTADELLTANITTNGIFYGPKEGDCEDGAVLIYVLCRLLGVPASDLFLWCGDVVGGGHCCCIYRPHNYPLNWVFLDWCYIPDTRSIEMWRCIYEIDGKLPCGEQVGPNGALNENGFDKHYINTWWVFNEKTSYTSLNYAGVK